MWGGEAVIEILTQTAEGECRHCGGRIVRHGGGRGSDYGWTHDLGEGYQYECPGAPVAEPRGTARP